MDGHTCSKIRSTRLNTHGCEKKINVLKSRNVWYIGCGGK